MNPFILNGLIDGKGMSDSEDSVSFSNGIRVLPSVFQFSPGTNKSRVQCIICPQRRSGYRSMDRKDAKNHSLTALHRRHLARHANSRLFLPGSLVDSLSSTNSDNKLSMSTALPLDTEVPDHFEQEPVMQYDPNDNPAGMTVDSDLEPPSLADCCHAQDNPSIEEVPIANIWKEYYREHVSEISKQEFHGDVFDALQDAVTKGERLFQPHFRSFNEGITDHGDCEDSNNIEHESDFGIELPGMFDRIVYTTLVLTTVPEVVQDIPNGCLRQKLPVKEDSPYFPFPSKTVSAH